MQLLELKPRPVGDDAAALDHAADQEGDRAGAVVGADRAVDAGGAAEFGDDHHHCVGPALLESALEGSQRVVQPAQKPGEAAGRAALVGVGVPTLEGERSDAGAVIGGDELRRAFRDLAHALGIVGSAAGAGVAHPLARHDALDVGAGG